VCGTGRCEHDRLRSRCVICLSGDQLRTLATQCVVCGVTQVCRKRSKARGGTGMCSQCDSVKSSRRSEAQLIETLCAMGVPPPSAVDNVTVGGPSCAVARRRPDVAWVLPTFVVNLEIDEDSHTNRQPSCEVGKAQDTRFGAEGGGKPLVIIRYNPDQYTDGTTEDRRRLEYLARVIKFCILLDIRDLHPLHPNVIFLHYHRRAQKHIDAIRDAGFPFVVLPDAAMPLANSAHSPSSATTSRVVPRGMAALLRQETPHALTRSHTKDPPTRHAVVATRCRTMRVVSSRTTGTATI
jgi:hypothetical protein